jgi:uncharacterized protein involved in propanediol utilization
MHYLSALFGKELYMFRTDLQVLSIIRGLNIVFTATGICNPFSGNLITGKTHGKKLTLTLPVLLYGRETWTIKAGDARRITAAEMKYMRRTAGYI